MAAKRDVLVVSDNEYILNAFVDVLRQRPALVRGRRFKFVCSAGNADLAGRTFGAFTVEWCDVKASHLEILSTYDLVISAHCKQIFPAALAEGCTCINIHPGLNPHNRGWFPQVFSILNGLPLGATIHEIDAQVDHGDIIDQIAVPVHQWDTSLDAYERVLRAEVELMHRSLEGILNDTYSSSPPSVEGNLNRRRDFEALREIELNQQVTFGQAIDRLRALTHGQFRNAFFRDPATGRKVYVSVSLQPEENQD